MVIFLYGPDTFRLNRKLKQIINEYKNRGRGINFAVFNSLDEPANDFFAELRQDSLFGEKKLFVVKAPVSNKEFKESLIDGIEKIAASEHNIVFVQEGKVLKADRLLKALSKLGQTQEFDLLENAGVESWAAAEFKRLGKPVSPKVVRLLVERVGNDLWRLENEIQKLVHFAIDREINIDDVAKNVTPAISAGVFDAIDAVASRSRERMFALTRERLAAGDHPIYFLAMVAGQLKNLLLIKSSPAAGAAGLGMHPFVFGKSRAQANRFSLDELKAAYRTVCGTDLDIKTGRVSPEAGLDMLLARI